MSSAAAPLPCPRGQLRRAGELLDIVCEVGLALSSAPMEDRQAMVRLRPGQGRVLVLIFSIPIYEQLFAGVTYMQRRRRRGRCSHYRNPGLCRVPGALPSAFCRTLGKDFFVENRTRQHPTLGNEVVYRVQDTWYRTHSAKATLDKEPSASV
jgi:hypothetical protein